MIVDSPFILRDRAYWPLVAVIGICTIGLTVIGIGFGILSSMLSGGQITEVQRPTRSAIVPWPFVTPPALLTIVAAALALGASILLAARTSVRTSGFLTTTFGWSLAGMLGAGALAVAFPNARVGGSALIPGLSDHAIGAAGFALGAVTSILGQTRLQTGYTAARAAGLNPAFFPIVPRRALRSCRSSTSRLRRCGGGSSTTGGLRSRARTIVPRRCGSSCRTGTRPRYPTPRRRQRPSTEHRPDARSSPTPQEARSCDTGTRRRSMSRKE
ncbi:hypothetical protein OVN20_01410 [Microcella daejeonensis]|uniref:hypothetical protein n=1 Tax=Microcella daejeonensis TaxID=2994971 RepID=UPI00226DC778|nr:hypothetical protein [Microcella daejeonensis]WAB84261.1 hypothetical protein OVN20_01410 [Microcella daejeonensis]